MTTMASARTIPSPIEAPLLSPAVWHEVGPFSVLKKYKTILAYLTNKSHHNKHKLDDI